MKINARTRQVFWQDENSLPQPIVTQTIIPDPDSSLITKLLFLLRIAPQDQVNYFMIVGLVNTLFKCGHLTAAQEYLANDIIEQYKDLDVLIKPNKRSQECIWTMD